jgi:hypothetical protein
LVATEHIYEWENHLMAAVRGSHNPIADTQYYALVGQSGGQSAGHEMDRLVEAVEAQARRQSERLGRYMQIASAGDDPAIALVMGLVAVEQQRDQAMLQRVAITMRDALNWTQSPDALPATRLPDGEVCADLVATTRALLEQTRTDARHLDSIAHRHKSSADLNSLLLEMMALDNQKHIRVVQFVLHRLQSRAKAARERESRIHSRAMTTLPMARRLSR